MDLKLRNHPATHGSATTQPAWTVAIELHKLLFVKAIELLQ
jgi:hypothetical protein